MDWMHELSRVAWDMILQAAVLHEKNAWCLAEGQWSHPWTSKNYWLPGSFSRWAHYSPCKDTSRQDRTTGTATELATASGPGEQPHMWGDSRLWEVRRGVKARTSGNHSFPSPLLLSSRKLAKPALTVPSLPWFCLCCWTDWSQFCGFSSCENVIHCPRINFEEPRLLEWAHFTLWWVAAGRVMPASKSWGVSSF